MILAFILNVNKEYLIINETAELDEHVEKEFEEKIKLLLEHIPIQHITKKQEFMKLELFVNEHVLIPRADTEILVEEIMHLCQNKDKTFILDLCTGSGAIGIALAKYIAKAQIIGIDLSEKALEIANQNIANQQLENMKCIRSDLFENLKEYQFDVIVSNPPYIKSEVINTLEEEVKKEPMIALDGGVTGLDFYLKIVDHAYQYLKQDGILALEIGYDQKEEVINMIKNSKKYTDIYFKKDLNGNDRIVVCKKR